MTWWYFRSTGLENSNKIDGLFWMSCLRISKGSIYQKIPTKVKGTLQESPIKLKIHDYESVTFSKNSKSFHSANQPT